ncbi:hypothetical protein BKA70DRAFT_1286711 [Coprinopsis sp. MPI-PUGE-AT-0042]|nr:hypothetical protein BKA70DRAFT_1316819 [Coprinopsis sp. MPI-PUGE-AT-0042]KAH6906724.1 hypothetical protein BKA70DRAFT_1286711 [Coprinopsis sp. MPI-PUGE-AT-0042]
MPSGAFESLKNTLTGEPSAVSGDFHSAKGDATKEVGKVADSSSWISSGRQEHLAGETESSAANAKSFVQRTVDQVSSSLVDTKDAALESTVGGVAGDKTERELSKTTGHAPESIDTFNH